jgi:hypothetical protein
VRILQVTTMTNLNKTADRKRATRKRPVAGVGRVIGWPGGSLWIGRHVGRIQDHAHHAIQISLAMAGSFEVQASSWPQPRETRGMVVMPDRRHRFDGRGAMVATLFVEPNSVRGAALKQRFTGFDLALLRDAEVNPAVVNLKNRYAAAAPDESMRHSAEAAICRIAGKPSTVAETDRRVTSAIAWMGRRLGTPIRLDEVAAAVHLSPSRFRQSHGRFAACLAIVGARGPRGDDRIWRPLVDRCGARVGLRRCSSSHSNVPPCVRPGTHDAGARVAGPLNDRHGGNNAAQIPGVDDPAARGGGG